MTDKRHFLIDLGLVAFSQVALFYGAKYLLRSIRPADTTSAKHQEAKERSSEAMKRRGITAELDEYEQIIAGEIVWPEDLKIGFDGTYVGGY